MSAAGRPRENDREAILEQFEHYVDATDIPILAEFAVLARVGRNFIYTTPEFDEIRERCIAKKEAGLERGGLNGTLNPSVTIFSLKQLGWTDKQDVVHKGDIVQPIVISSVAGKW